jgi:DUF177 domain-containing protein
MFIDINTIGPEGLAFDRTLTLRQLEGPSRERIDDVVAHLVGSVVPSGKGAELSARIEATVLLQCGRCLEIFPWTVRADVDLDVVRKETDGESSQDVAVEEADTVLIAPQGHIGLEELATEQLYLNLPLKPICGLDCRGLCPRCGANRNVAPCGCKSEDLDPRLAPLLPFRKKAPESDRS